MDKFTTLEGVAAPMRTINVDTDRIIPAKYLKTIKRTGLGKSLFAEMRYREDGTENPDFVLNQPAYRQSKILVVGDNFGCGSSREHAPWALADFGIRCERGANATLTVDLAAQTIRGPDGGTLHFDIEPGRKHNLLNGLDEIGTTLERGEAIDAYEKKLAEREWA